MCCVNEAGGGHTVGDSSQALGSSSVNTQAAGSHWGLPAAPAVPHAEEHRMHTMTATARRYRFSGDPGIDPGEPGVGQVAILMDPLRSRCHTLGFTY